VPVCDALPPASHRTGSDKGESQGQMRALTATGAMGRMRYISGVSGGSFTDCQAPLESPSHCRSRECRAEAGIAGGWATLAYVFAQSTDDERLLGPIMQPEDLTMDSLGFNVPVHSAAPAHAHCSFPALSGFVDLRSSLGTLLSPAETLCPNAQPFQPSTRIAHPCCHRGGMGRVGRVAGLFVGIDDA
jgi:hypothetical protein